MAGEIELGSCLKKRLSDENGQHKKKLPTRARSIRQQHNPGLRPSMPLANGHHEKELVNTDGYISGGVHDAEWYINQDNFYRQIRKSATREVR